MSGAAFTTDDCISATVTLLNIHPSGAVDVAMRFSKNCSLSGSFFSTKSFRRAVYTKAQVVNKRTRTRAHTHTHTHTHTHCMVTSDKPIPSSLHPFQTQVCRFLLQYHRLCRLQQQFGHSLRHQHQPSLDMERMERRSRGGGGGGRGRSMQESLWTVAYSCYVAVPTKFLAQETWYDS